MKAQRILNVICNEFVYGGHLLSLGAVSIVFTSAILLKIDITWDFLIAVYLSVHAAYLYNRYKELRKDYLTNAERTRFLEKKIKIIPLIIFCFIIFYILILVIFSNFVALIFGIFLSMLSLFYSKFLKDLTRNVVGFKNIAVSILWALFIPLTIFYYNISSNESVLLILFFVFARLLLNTMFFDIKDIESDRKEKLKTIPVIFGKEKTFSILHILNIISFIPIIVGVYQYDLPLFSLLLVVFYFYSLSYLLIAKYCSVDIQKFSYIIVDGEYMLWPFVLIFGKFIFNI